MLSSCARRVVFSGGLSGHRLAVVLALALSACSDVKYEPPSSVSLPDPATLDDNAAIPDGPAAGIQIVSHDDHGVPTFITGPIGTLDTSAPGDSAIKLLREVAATYLGASGSETMIEPKVLVDDLGIVHVRVRESVHGIVVVGADLAIHADARTGEVRSYNGTFMVDDGWDTEPRLGADEAIRIALDELALPGAEVKGRPDLVYVVSQVSYGVSLAFRTMVSYQGEGGPESDYVFADSQNGAVMARHPTVYHAKHWQTHDAGWGTWLPGTLVCSNNQSCGDPVLQNIHGNVSKTYDYYMTHFGRDSIDGGGMTIRSTGHYASGYNNAFWNSSQTVFGDGDGALFGPLGSALDVVAHEITHGVTEHEMGLIIYQNESGALNEAMSDIFGAATEAYVNGSVNANTWKIGEAVYTPNTPGDALRYMNDPTADGVSRDYYPQRYLGTADAGGVHWNSGIVNLAFYLLSQGGMHPHGKTVNLVTGLGLAKAEQIFYRAQKYYITSSTDMKGARHATALAAYQLYGTQGFRSVHQAWCAVGVPDCPAYRAISRMYTGDFDGDGPDEILVVYADGEMNMFKYVNGNMQCVWGNGNDPNAGGGIYPYRNDLIVGDFDGDGRTDLLGTAGWMTMFHFYGGDWHWGWSNYGNPSAGDGIYPYQNSLVVGDFNGDGRDDVLGTGGWMTMFHFSGGDWHWGWSNYGSTSAGDGIYPYRNRLVPGKFDGTGRDRLFGLNSWNTVFSFESDQTFHWGWSDYGDILALGMCN